MGKLMTIIGTLIVIGIICGVGYFSYTILIKTGQTTEMSVQYGDAVYVNYIGKFENGKVFDTSLWNVASDNITFPKAVSFTMRTTKTEYTALNFTVGKGTVIKGWDKGVIGMKIGETRILNISKDDAYGASDTSKIITLPVVQKIPIISDMNRTIFKEKYDNITPVVNMAVKDPVWGWSSTIISVSGEIVTMRANPSVDEVVHPYKAWNSVVIYIDSSADSGKGAISVRHEISAGLVNNVKDTDSAGQEFRLTGYSSTLGTFTIDYNREVAGKTLVFTITLVRIFR